MRVPMSTVSPLPHLFNVLVVDDDEDSVESLAFCLQQEGRVVRCAMSGEEALAMAETFTPHIALVDIFMPRLDGHALAQQLRRRFGTSTVLVAVTGAVRSVDLGTFDFQLTKPVNFVRLEELFEHAQQRAGFGARRPGA
ncbi:MAG: response regulator [Rubrivivax sp.]|nr:MAG: response regulator [Rubrivivax sp.]